MKCASEVCDVPEDGLVVLSVTSSQTRVRQNAVPRAYQKSSAAHLPQSLAERKLLQPRYFFGAP